MATWKLTIRPDHKVGLDPFSLCRIKSLVGVGWAYIFENKTIASKQDSYNALVEVESKIPAAIKTLLDEVQAGDFIWLTKVESFSCVKLRTTNASSGRKLQIIFKSTI